MRTGHEGDVGQGGVAARQEEEWRMTMRNGADNWDARDLKKLALTLAGALEGAAYALFDAGHAGEGTPFDRAQLALRHPLLARLRGEEASAAPGGRDPDVTWYGMTAAEKDAVLMAASMFQRLGQAAQQIGATGGAKAVMAYIAQPDVRAMIEGMWPIAPKLREDGYDIEIAADVSARAV